MEIIVLLSRSLDSEQVFTLKNGQLAKTNAKYMINPLDEIALEEALTLKEIYGGSITVLTASQKEAEKQIRLALAMGADKAVLLEVNETELEPSQIARLIASGIQQMQYDLILAGNFSIDGGSGQVGPRVATILNIPFFMNTRKIEAEKELVSITIEKEGDYETYQGAFPLLATVPQGLNEPRLPALAGIMKAKRKPLTIIQPPMEPNKIPSFIEHKVLYQPNMERQKQMLEGDQVANTLATILKDFYK